MTNRIAGDHLYSKSGRFLSPKWPTHFDAAHGVNVYAGGVAYLDLSHGGAGTCPLGYNHPVVNNNVHRRVALGSMSMLNPPEDEVLAEVLLTHPSHQSWAERVRFARTGGEAIAVAVHLARVRTERQEVVRIAGGYHGWYVETDDSGRVLTADSVTSASQLFAPPMHSLENWDHSVAAVIVDCSTHRITIEFARSCREQGVILIADEISSGYRGTRGPGVSYEEGAGPDIAVMAKGMSNGFPMAAIMGRADIMSAAEDTWLSSTYWTDSIGPAAALGTWEVYETEDVAGRLFRLAEYARDAIYEAAVAAGVDSIRFSARNTSLVRWVTPYDEDRDVRTYIVEAGLARSLLVTPGAFYPMLPHETSDIDQLVELLQGCWTAAVDGKIARRSDSELAQILRVR